MQLSGVRGRNRGEMESLVSSQMPRLVDEYRELVCTLEETLSDEKNVCRVRAEMRKRFGHFQVEADDEEFRFLAQDRAVEAALLREATGRQIILVARA